MVEKRPSASDIAGNDEENNLSEYEKLRLQKMRRNEERMKELGLLETKHAISSLRQKKAKAAKKQKPAPQLPQRRSSRKRKTVANYNEEQVIPMHSDEEQFDQADSEEESDDGTDNENEDSYELPDDENRDNDSDEEDEFLVAERPAKKRKRADPESEKGSAKPSGVPSAAVATTDAAAPAFECANPSGGLTLERAKTGRSKCRRCRQTIGKGEPRVGMEAWIVGRNCVTWQCPPCLLRNLCCVYERSGGGKGRCKASDRPFARGQLKIGIRCHTATSYYHVRSVAGVLNNVMDLMATDSGGGGNAGDCELTVESISGNEKLSERDRETLESVLKTVSANREATGAGATEGSPEQDSAPENEIAGDKESPRAESSGAKKKAKKKKKIEQPEAGSKTGARGKVEWKFGGRTCYGTLLPSKETETHCYARTHRGNTKTLAKGKDYWSVIA